MQLVEHNLPEISQELRALSRLDFVDRLGYLHAGLLNKIRWIDLRTQTWIDFPSHDCPQQWSVPSQQFVYRDGTWTYAYDSSSQLIRAELLANSPKVQSKDMSTNVRRKFKLLQMERVDGGG